MAKNKIGINERSTGGEVISYMNVLFSKYDWGMAKAGGEYSVRKGNSTDKEANTLFPDDVIFADMDGHEPLVSIEFKMPDYPTSGPKYDFLYQDAKDKANRMGTSAFVLYNFQYAEVFLKHKNKWNKHPDKLMDKYSNILTDRTQVRNHLKLWHKTVVRLLKYLYLNIRAKKIVPAPIEFSIKNYIQIISNQLIPRETRYLKNSGNINLLESINYWSTLGKSEFTNKKLTQNQAIIAFSKYIIMRWINRIIFANLLKTTQNSIRNTLIAFCRDKNIIKFKNNLNNDTKRTDFYSILSVGKYEEVLPKSVIKDLADFTAYLINVSLSKNDQTHNNEKFVSKMLEALINASKRKLMGLYTTPPKLACLLAYLTITNTNGNFADFAVGSGTIAHQIYEILKDFNKSDNYIHHHLWISDKYVYPLQIANLNITNVKSLGLVNLSFLHNALDLRIGMPIKVVNPNIGNIETYNLPKMNYVISNLPFINSNNRSKDDEPKLKAVEKNTHLNNKIDLYQGILLHLRELVDTHFRIGVITSDSWFRTMRSYKSFFKVLTTYFDIKDIVITNVGRFFKDVGVITSLIILGPKTHGARITNFVGLNKELSNMSFDDIKKITWKIHNNISSKAFSLCQYSYNTIINLINDGMGLEPLFDNLNWFPKIQSKICPLTNIFKEERGTRTGRDSLFLTHGLQTDKRDSVPCLKNLKNVNSFLVKKSPLYMVSTNKTVSEIMNSNHIKTIKFIRNKQNDEQAIKQIHKHGRNKWIIAEQEPKKSDFVTSLNPERRFFWVRLGKHVTANQRLILLATKSKYSNQKTLLHALLNSIIPIFMLISSGFGRAQGAMDLNVNGIRQIYLLNPDLLNSDNKNKIIKSWNKLSKYPVEDIFEELHDSKWIKFNKIILRAYGLNCDLYKSIRATIESILKRHESARENK